MSKVKELEQCVETKSARIAELEEELLKAHVEAEDKLRDLDQRHQDEVRNRSLQEESHLDALKKEFEARRDDDVRISREERDSAKMELARMEESRDNDRKEAQASEERLRDALSAAEDKVRAMEDKAREQAAQVETQQRDQARMKAKLEDDFRREIMTLRTAVNRAEEIAAAERKAKEKALDERMTLEKEVAALRASASKK